jgi:hypothetical protein
MNEMNRVKALETMLVLVLALCIAYWFTRNTYWLIAAMVLAAIGLIIPPLTEKIHVLWMKMAQGMGFIMNKVILTLVFIFFLIPVSFLYKLFRRSRTNLRQGNASHFKTRNYTYSKESMENVW